MPQFEAALALMPRDTPGLENERARLFEYACNAASLQGDYARAAALCTDGLAELVKAREPNKDQLFSLPFDLAYMKAKEGAAPGDVERLYRQSADAAALHFGKSDLRFDIAMTRVGIARFDAGDLDSARQILENVVSGMRSLPGPPVELVIAERALAPVYRVQGSFALAEEHARQALMLLEKRPASFIDRYLIELEMFLDRALQGQADSAVGESESVVTAVLSKLPQGHIDRTRPSLMSGRILTLAMRCRDAEPRLREALLIYRTRLPLWPVMQAESLAALAECLACQGREGEAQQAAGEALRLYREAFGPRASGHPSVTAVKAVLGASAVR
jgi:tetratricopeptide (TPR) repeat protein